MTSFWRDGRGVFWLLVLALVLISVLQFEAAGRGLVRWSGYSVLIPLVAAALLPFWRTLIVGALSLAAIIATYGFLVSGVSVGGRVVVVSAVAVSFGVSLQVCRVRLDREERLKRIMIARDRLALLSEASKRIGGTLNVAHTVRELAEVAVPRFADYVTVDLFGAVLRGEEPPTAPLAGPVSLRRVAQRSVLAGCPESALKAGEGETYPPVSLPARCLAAVQPVRAQFLEGADVDQWLVSDPRRAALVREYGIHSAIAVPLCARGSALGAAMFMRHERPDRFDADDLVLAEEIVARAAVCVDNARRYTLERETSLTLQHSCLPRHLPKLAAAEVVSRYLPAGSGVGVGGDWFDVIPLSGARVALVVGDVVGHGLQASATMARLRAAVRALADMDLPPDELLTHLDDVVIRLRAEGEDGGGGPGAPEAEDSAGEIGATCLYAVYDPVAHRCALARAAHVPPAVVMPDHSTEIIDLPPGPPLGLGGWPFESVEVDLPEGSLLVLYTDGLVRSHGYDLDSGLQRLLTVLARPEEYLDAACEAALRTMRDDQPTDDAALLIARTHILDADHVATWDLPADPAVVAEARDHVSSQLAAWGVEDAVFTTELVVSELVTNAIRYARPPVQLRVILERGSLTCEVSDGSDTSPHLRRARTYDEGGRGLFIVAQLAERWGTRHSRDGKTIWAEQVVEAV
ncbi:ATP-binding SpoIIE family protein phosphatase [Streptomyces chiangmaiensis]|uniref:SpoIIE family protein phosphatase n=1 Tax=Streptomyces chiangmaiensis TaxID=766497 RepID=A0ABU7FGC0_9ACTN|nr:SpoIIE family protein phosphatase [Streptomyces chiangmaiensis]MED7822893.1 SpoIIE family protein phosphatase [Streptomyces chiangmaiensis]